MKGQNQIIHGDCLPTMCDMPENSIDAIVTDPPYALTTTKRWKDTDQFAQNQSDVGKRFSKGFMGKEWDGQLPGIEIWQECLRVSKPGAHMLAFGGTRTHHRLMVAIEDAGWEIRDCLGWIYGSGFPKSLDVSKAIDKAAGEYKPGCIKPSSRSKPSDSGFMMAMKTENAPTTDAAKQWNGWGTALKPAWEPIILCRKPLSEKTVAENVQKWGTGALNIDACRIGTEQWIRKATGNSTPYGKGLTMNKSDTPDIDRSAIGRFPANLIHDGSDEVVGLFPETSSGLMKQFINGGQFNVYGKHYPRYTETIGDSGSAARFFYTAKADTTERNKYLKGRPLQKVNDGRDTPIDNPFQRGETLRKNIHPTVKPIDLLQYLARLITPPKGTILDPFAGSGSTGIAAFNEGFNYILIEIEKEYVDIAKVRNAQTGLPS